MEPRCRGGGGRRTTTEEIMTMAEVGGGGRFHVSQTDPGSLRTACMLGYVLCNGTKNTLRQWPNHLHSLPSRARRHKHDQHRHTTPTRAINRAAAVGAFKEAEGEAIMVAAAAASAGAGIITAKAIIPAAADGKEEDGEEEEDEGGVLPTTTPRRGPTTILHPSNPVCPVPTTRSRTDTSPPTSRAPRPWWSSWIVGSS